MTKITEVSRQIVETNILPEEKNKENGSLTTSAKIENLKKSPCRPSLAQKKVKVQEAKRSSAEKFLIALACTAGMSLTFLSMRKWCVCSTVALQTADYLWLGGFSLSAFFACRLELEFNRSPSRSTTTSLSPGSTKKGSTKKLKKSTPSLKHKGIKKLTAKGYLFILGVVAINALLLGSRSIFSPDSTNWKAYEYFWGACLFLPNATVVFELIELCAQSSPKKIKRKPKKPFPSGRIPFPAYYPPPRRRLK